MLSSLHGRAVRIALPNKSCSWLSWTNRSRNSQTLLVLRNMNSRGPSRWLVLPLAAGQIAVSAIGRQRTAPQVPERVLIAHDLLLGDTIMLTPLLAKCRERWPSADIVMTCAPSYCGLYAMRPYGVRVLPYDPRDVHSLQRLRAEASFDLALIPGDNRYSWLARALRARWVVGFSGADARYKDWPIDELRSYPDVPTAWADLAAGLIDGPAPARYRMTHWPAPPAAAFEAPAEPYCVIHAGASSTLKRWPADRWSEVARRLETVDLRIAHLGRLVGVPTLALFGPGSALLSGAGDFWRDSPFTALTIPDFPCRDQTITMRRDVRWIRRCERFQGTAPGQCPEARCMLALSVDDVWRVAGQLLLTASNQPRPATAGASA